MRRRSVVCVGGWLLLGLGLVETAAALSLPWGRAPQRPSTDQYPLFSRSPAERRGQAEQYELVLELQRKRNYWHAAEELEELLSDSWPIELDRMYLLIRLASLYDRAEAADRAAELLAELQQRVSADHPLYPELLFVLARTALDPESPEPGLEAFRVLLHAYEYSEAAQRALLELARFFRDRTEYEKAWEYYDRHLATYLGRKKRPSILAESVRMFLEAGWNDRAESTARALWEEVRRYPEAGSLGVSLARSFRKHQRVEMARWLAERVALGQDQPRYGRQWNSDDAQQAQMLIAELWELEGNREKALSAWKTAVMAFPVGPQTLTAYGNLTSLYAPSGLLPALPRFDRYPEEGELAGQLVLVRARGALRLNRYTECVGWLRPLRFADEELRIQHAGLLTRALLEWADAEEGEPQVTERLYREAVAVRPFNPHSDRAFKQAIDHLPDFAVEAALSRLLPASDPYAVDVAEAGLKHLLDHGKADRVLSLLAEGGKADLDPELTYYRCLAELGTGATAQTLDDAVRLMETETLRDDEKRRLRVALATHHLIHRQWSDAIEVLDVAALSKKDRRMVMAALHRVVAPLAQVEDSLTLYSVASTARMFATTPSRYENYLVELVGALLKAGRFPLCLRLLSETFAEPEDVPKARRSEWMEELTVSMPTVVPSADAAGVKTLARLAAWCASTRSALDGYMHDLVLVLMQLDRADDAVAALRALPSGASCNPLAISTLAEALIPREETPDWTPLLWECDLGQGRTLDVARLAERHGRPALREALLSQFVDLYPDSASHQRVVRWLIEARLALQDNQGAWELTQKHLQGLPLNEALDFAHKMRRFYEGRASDRVEWLNSFILAHARDDNDLYTANESLAEYYQDLQNHQAALPHLSEAFRLAGNRPAREQVKIGARLLRAVLATGQDPTYADGLVRSLRSLITQVSDPDRRAAAGNQLAKSLQEVGRLEEARDVFWETAQRNPDTSSGQAALFNLAKSHAETGESDAAIEVYLEFLRRYEGQRDEPWPHLALANLLSLAADTDDPAFQQEIRAKTEAMVNGVRDPELSLDLAQYFGRQGQNEIQAMLLDRAVDDAIDRIETTPDPDAAHRTLNKLVLRLHKQGFANEAVALGEQFQALALGDDRMQQTEALYKSQYQLMVAMLKQRYRRTNDMEVLAREYLQKTREHGYKEVEADFLYILTMTSNLQERWDYREQLVARHGDSQHALHAKIMLAGRAYYEQDFDRALTLAQDAVAQSEAPYWKEYADKFRYNALYIAAELYREGGRGAEADALYRELQPFLDEGRKLYVREIMDGRLR